MAPWNLRDEMVVHHSIFLINSLTREYINMYVRMYYLVTYKCMLKYFCENIHADIITTPTSSAIRFDLELSI